MALFSLWGDGREMLGCVSVFGFDREQLVWRTVKGISQLANDSERWISIFATLNVVRRASRQLRYFIQRRLA
jgi:hypothetical protein